ncbi:MAG TPA: hypothetical protein VJB87_04385 [Candidatus Nanoarchaeia archaeon]|nr:hypothetical protein [Candidatus Nanoarchaeia archaeon]
MPNTEYEIKNILVKQFEPRQSHIIFDINYSKNGAIITLTKDYKFDDPANFVKQIIHDIKKKDATENWEDNDPLAGYQVINLKNQEDTEERLLNFIARIHEKARLMKRMKDAKKYMQLFDDMKTARMLIA